MSSSSISRLLPVTALALLAAAPAFAQQKLVPAESSVGFVSRQMAVPVEGHFRKFDGQLNFDPAVPEQGKAVIEVDLSSIDGTTDTATGGENAKETM